GVRMFMEAPLSRIKEVYINETLHNKVNIAARYGDNNEESQLLKNCAAKLKESGYVDVSDQVFNKMSDTVTPQGILTVVSGERHKLFEMLAGRDRDELKILILEGIQDPGNLGTMLRTAEAAGYDFILANEGTVDMYNPKVIRSTMGSIFRVPVVYSQDLRLDVGLLRSKGVVVLAAHLSGKRSFREVNAGPRLAIMIGNEGSGLTDEIAAMADECVRIPMKGKVESLNAAVAAALMMFDIS
ncbi:MAG: RNA methyltransferase, partial [Lachnospiraceae bacterium]|nr:RNA methyltransferase [Lachnospiraceae bacterium]